MLQFGSIDYAILCIYFLFVIGIGFFIKKNIKSSQDFLSSGKSLPLWITSFSFIAANLGAQELIGMAASGAKYGMVTAHFYWIGAIPAMVFLALFMMPFYYNSQARSVTEYLKLRFDEKTRAFNALTFAVKALLSSGISLYALAMLLDTLLGWSFETSVIVSTVIVLGYICLGGLTSAVYNEVLQFFLILLGMTPVVFLGIAKLGGWEGFLRKLPVSMIHTWKYLGEDQNNPMGVTTWSIIVGLGFILSFGYWCTDFLIIQRAIIAKNLSSAQKTPLVAALPKALLPFLVVLPGLIAIALIQAGTGFQLPLTADQQVSYNMTLPLILCYFLPSGILGLGLTALIASFITSMAGNLTAFNTIWTYDIYQVYLKKAAPDRHYLMMGRLATLVGMILSVGGAYLTRSFNNLNDLLQLICGFINVPLFATFSLGMFWKRCTGHGAFFGLILGTVAASITHGVTIAEGKGAWLVSVPWHQFQSGMAQAICVAIVAWIACFSSTILISLQTTPRSPESLQGLVYGTTQAQTYLKELWYQKPWVLALVVIILTLVLNYIWY